MPRKILITMPNPMIEMLDLLASKEDVNRSVIIRDLLREAIDNRKL